MSTEPEKITEEALINQIIQTGVKGSGVNTNLISDGYHSFGELYDHRFALFLALCRFIDDHPYSKPVWKSKLHYDGSAYEGWFIVGIGEDKGKQISYHLPLSRWDECDFIQTIDKAPEWDGHTSADVLERLKSL